MFNYQNEKELKYQSTLNTIVANAKDEKYYYNEHMIFIPQKISFTKFFIGIINNNEDFEDLNNNWNHNFFYYSRQESLIIMLKMFFSQSFFKEFCFNKRLFTNIVWQCIFYYDKRNNSFHNFKHALNVVHSINYFCDNLICVKRVFSEECPANCYIK